MGRYRIYLPQLKKSLEKTNSKKPTMKMFKAIKSNTSETIGHIQFVTSSNKCNILTLNRF